MRDSKPVRNT